MKILIAALVGLLSVCSAFMTSALEIVAPREVKPGEVFFVEIKNSLGKDLVGGKFDGGELKFFQWGDKFGVLVGVDIAAKEGEIKIVVEEFAPGDAPAPMQQFLVRVLKSGFPETEVKRKKPTPAEQKRIKKDKDVIYQAVQKSESYPLWREWFSYPLENSLVSRGGEFGIIRKSVLGATHHTGVDFGGITGTPVRSSNIGRVVFVGNFFLEGKMIIIDHGFGLFSLYMHLDSAAVKTGDLVTRGMVIGALGKSGRATGPNLHFAFLLGGKRIDPLGLLKLGEIMAAKDKEKTASAKQQKKSSIYDWVRLGKEMLRQEPIHFWTSKAARTTLLKKGKQKRRVSKEVAMVISKEILLAVLDSAEVIRIVRLEIVPARVEPRRLLNIRKVTPENCSVEKAGGGGVNTNFKVVCGGEERRVVASAHVIFDDTKTVKRIGNTARKIIYTPYADEFIVPGTVLLGRLYIESQIKDAEKELKHLAVRSRAVPDRLVAAIFSGELLFNLSLIEHIDHDEFAARGAVYTGEKVLVQFALNQEDTFRYATSSAGALCLMQIMPSTYREIRQQYPQAKLSASPERGSCEHQESIRAAYLVLDSKLARMPTGLQQAFLQDPEKYGIFLAAAYNGGSDRAAEWYQKFGPERLAKILKDSFLESIPSKKGPKETWFFIKKYMEIANEFIGEE